jgi:WD40 repeat protein
MMHATDRQARIGQFSRLWPAGLLVLVGISGCAGATTLTLRRPKHVAFVRKLVDGGGLIALGSNHLLAILTERHLVIVNATEGDTLFSTSSPTHADLNTDRALVFSDDASLLAASVNEALLVVDVQAHTVLARHDYVRGSGLRSIGALAFSPDNRQLLIGGQINQVFVMDVPSGHMADSLAVSNGGTVGMSVLRDGTTAAIAGSDGRVQLWAWKDHATLETLGDCEGWCSAADASARFVVAGCEGHSIRVWNSQSRRLAGTIRDHQFIGLRLSTTKLNDLLIAGSGPGSPRNSENLTTSEIIVFDLSTLQPIASWRAHTADGIYDVAASPDGSLFATCGYDRVVNLWRLEE